MGDERGRRERLRIDVPPRVPPDRPPPAHMPPLPLMHRHRPTEHGTAVWRGAEAELDRYFGQA